jgi:hypothetical protein
MHREPERFGELPGKRYNQEVKMWQMHT